ncbi:hypothetical protein LguiB_003759 [Lonicera macranthoides]
MNASDLREFCSIELMVMTSWSDKDESSLSFSDIRNALLYGFELSWFKVLCKSCRDKYNSCYCAHSNKENCLSDEGYCYSLFHHHPSGVCPSLFWALGGRCTCHPSRPALINRSIGSVPYKADVYSFGMLMEMVGLKRNVSAIEDNLSQYIPSWVFDRFGKGKDIEMGYRSDDKDDKKTTKKMTFMGFVVHTNESVGPSLDEQSREMVEGEVEHLRIPPEPFQSQQQEVDAMTWSKIIVG